MNETTDPHPVTEQAAAARWNKDARLIPWDDWRPSGRAAILDAFRDMHDAGREHERAHPTDGRPCETLDAPNMQTIENARLDDVLAGDRLTWTWVWERDGVTRTEIREGIAHHRNDAGDWCTKDGRWIASETGDGATLTIRRPTAPELPPEQDGVVLIPANGHKVITTVDGQEFTRLTYSAALSMWYGPNPAALPGDPIVQTSISRLTPGTWKLADQ